MQTTIQQIVEKARKNRDLYHKNETATREQLINPILDELGWRTADPDFVIPSLPSDEGGIPDYTLRKQDRTVIYVEAKNLAANLNDHISQLAKYCYNQGTEFGVLTNGLQWMLLKTFEKGTKLSDRIVWQIDLERDDQVTIAKRISSISYRSIDGLANIVEKDKMLQLVWETFITNPDPLLSSLLSVFIQHVQANHPNVDFDIDDVRNFFESRLKSLLKARSEEGQGNYSEDVGTRSQNDLGGYGGRKTPSPSASEWQRKVPELAKVSGLNTWKAICDHLKVEVAGDSARRRLKEWVTKHRPHWPEVPEPE